MKYILPGGSGQIGKILAEHLFQQGHEVVVLSRKPAPSPWRTIVWDGRTPEPAWTRELNGADCVINLAGRSVNCRYSPNNRREILGSRVDSARAVAAAIARAERPPRMWLQSSTATIYAHRYDSPNDEATGQLGGADPASPDTWRFSVDVAMAWERALEEAPTPSTRKVALRSAMVMSPHSGGVFDTLLRLVRFGLGGTAGDGRQYVSWIHDLDFLRAIDWICEHDELVGPVNIASPHPVPNADFQRELRKAWGIRIGLPAAGWMLEIGAAALRTETELVLKSRRVVPGRLLQSGFRFEYPAWPQTAADLCRRWRDPSTRHGSANTQPYE